MQFGIFSVGDVTADPTTGRTPTEAERIRATVAIAKKAEEVGLDVFATGEHHNPPFVPSSPTTLLGYVSAQTDRIILSTATTLITTNDPVKIAEDFSVLQNLSGGRVDLMLGRGNTRAGLPLVRAGHPGRDPIDGRALWAAATAVAGGGRRLDRELPHRAAGFHPGPAAVGRSTAVRLAWFDPHPGGCGIGRLLWRRFLP
jgi:alkanesulfonate monooxygenase SsuD/methylene tetrahydromethanopterin reductase-like flavin-dependent oxidoreductase (luciferase family)